LLLPVPFVANLTKVHIIFLCKLVNHNASGIVVLHELFLCRKAVRRAYEIH
jgi:hypothetical protein